MICFGLIRELWLGLNFSGCRAVAGDAQGKVRVQVD